MARDELQFLLTEPELENIPLLILANKQDLDEAIGPDELESDLALPMDGGTRQVKIQEASALLDKGLEEGFKWLTKVLTNEEEDSD